MTSLTISQLARRSGVPTTTLRYYEKVGVIPPTTRADSGYRIKKDAADALKPYREAHEDGGG
jgi:DNA-binding transcriptional MerR regulator